MNIYDTFTTNSDYVQFIKGTFEAFHPSGKCTDRIKCESCIFKFNTKEESSCYVKPSNKDFQRIYDFFKLHHPEKLL